MATKTGKLGLIKPDLTDSPPDITKFNSNWDKLDEAYANAGKGDIDCGYFVEDQPTVASHNMASASHANIVLDGNESTAAVKDQTLEEHMVDETAHQNMTVDGNDS